MLMMLQNMTLIFSGVEFQFWVFAMECKWLTENSEALLPKSQFVKMDRYFKIIHFARWIYNEFIRCFHQFSPQILLPEQLKIKKTSSLSKTVFSQFASGKRNHNKYFLKHPWLVKTSDGVSFFSSVLGM